METDIGIGWMVQFVIQHSSAELQDLVICEVLLKYLMMNILIAFHSALYVSIAVIMSDYV